MGLWWLEPGWTQAQCACGATIYPEGDPDWGMCAPCFTAHIAEQTEMAEREAAYHREMERQFAAEIEDQSQ